MAEDVVRCFRGTGTTLEKRAPTYAVVEVTAVMVGSRIMGLRPAAERALGPEVRFTNTENSDAVYKKAWKTEEPQSPVELFVAQHDLETFVRQAEAKVRSYFGERVEVEKELFLDPADGTPRLYWNIKGDDREVLRGIFRGFCNEWWYDHIGEVGSLVGFRVLRGQVACNWRDVQRAAVLCKTALRKSYEEYLARTAISEYYYSAYHRAREWAKAHMGYVRDGGASHQHLWTFLSNGCNVPALIDIGYDQCHSTARVHADYLLENTLTYEDFSSYWRDIEALHAFLAELPPMWVDDEAWQALESDKLRGAIR